VALDKASLLLREEITIRKTLIEYNLIALLLSNLLGYGALDQTKAANLVDLRTKG